MRGRDRVATVPKGMKDGVGSAYDALSAYKVLEIKGLENRGVNRTQSASEMFTNSIQSEIDLVL